MFRRSNFAHHMYNSVALSIKTNMWQSSTMQPCLTANLCKHFLFYILSSQSGFVDLDILSILTPIIWLFILISTSAISIILSPTWSFFNAHFFQAKCTYIGLFLRISSTYFKLIVLISSELHLFRANYTYFKSTAPILSQFLIHSS